MSVAADPGWTVLAERHPPDACASTPFVPKGVRTVATAVAPAPRVRLSSPFRRKGGANANVREARRGVALTYGLHPPRLRRDPLPAEGDVRCMQRNTRNATCM